MGHKEIFILLFLCRLGAFALSMAVSYLRIYLALEPILNSGTTLDEVWSVLARGEFLISWTSLVEESGISQILQIFNGRSLGASGAIYGLLAAFVMLYPNAQLGILFIPIPIKAKYLIPILIGGDLFFGISGLNTGFGHFAHIGGALIGFIMMWYWKKNQFNQNRWN
ncbi:rhomboid family intramembrane serine protease [Aureicoccus marinus]|uniref:rhomboid family intramembrane serine protease n=1 Tax=Aureicoccus marinus TaxID=754435 RepID=UPI002936D5C4|nr:rhomboid family intramembrane serine protease [Aureicoccus marinus]